MADEFKNLIDLNGLKHFYKNYGIKAIQLNGQTLDKANGIINVPAVSIEANQGLTDEQKANARTNIGVGSSSFSGDYNDLTNKPTIPAAVAVKGNAESSYRTGNVNITPTNIGLGNVGNFKAVSTVASQGLSGTEKANARTNIGAGTSSFSGDYNDLANKPIIINNNKLTTDKEFIISNTLTATSLQGNTLVLKNTDSTKPNATFSLNSELNIYHSGTISIGHTLEPNETICSTLNLYGADVFIGNSNINSANITVKNDGNIDIYGNVLMYDEVNIDTLTVDNDTSLHNCAINGNLTIYDGVISLANDNATTISGLAVEWNQIRNAPRITILDGQGVISESLSPHHDDFHSYNDRYGYTKFIMGENNLMIAYGCTIVNGAGTNESTVTFPTEFNAPPIVTVCQGANSNVWNQGSVYEVTTISNGSFTVKCCHTQSGTNDILEGFVYVNWIAIGHYNVSTINQ